MSIETEKQDSYKDFENLFQSDPIISETLTNATSLKTLTDSYVMQTYQNYARGDFRGGEGAVHIFWANNYDPETKRTMEMKMPVRM